MTDILLTDDNDIEILAGDLRADFSDDQHQKLLLITHKGEWKENGQVGIGLDLFLKDDILFADVTKEINRQFEADGMLVNSVSFDDADKINIDAEYSNS